MTSLTEVTDDSIRNVCLTFPRTIISRTVRGLIAGGRFFYLVAPIYMLILSSAIKAIVQCMIKRTNKMQYMGV